MIGARAGARLRANRHGMRAHLPPAAVRGLLLAARRDGELGGVLIAAPPGAWPFPPPGWGARLRCLLGQGPGVARRWAEVASHLEQRHAVGPHWYLATLGVEPRLWGRGVGGFLLARWLEQVDADGCRAYLETDAPRNLPFYEGAGFRAIGEIRVFGVPVWLLERPVRAAGRP